MCSMCHTACRIGPILNHTSVIINQSVSYLLYSTRQCWKADQYKIRSIACSGVPCCHRYTHTSTMTRYTPPIWTFPSDLYIVDSQKTCPVTSVVIVKHTPAVCIPMTTDWTSNVGLMTLNSNERRRRGSPIVTSTKIFEKDLTN